MGTSGTSGTAAGTAGRAGALARAVGAWPAARPAGALAPGAPARRVRLPAAGWTRTGVLVARAFPADLPAADLLRLRLGGRRRTAPDDRTRDGTPIYVLSDAERRRAVRLLDRACLAGLEAHNVACTAGRYNVLALLGNSANFTGAQYFAVGTGAGTPAAGDRQLFTEYYRQNIGSATISGNTVDLNTVFGSGVANTTYTEAGLFASAPNNGTTSTLCASGGTTASATLNTGMLVAHVAFAYVKTAAIQLTADYSLYEN